MHTATLHELLADPAALTRPLDTLAEQLLARLAAELKPLPPTTRDALPSPQARARFRPLLACLARKSAQENGTAFDPHGGTLTFVRPGLRGPVRITGTFDNHSDAVRLVFHAPEPLPDHTHAPPPPGGASGLVEVFDPGVADHWIEDSEFALASDLMRLERVRATGAAEAAVLYCNRIVEAVARDAVGPGRQSAEPSLAALIGALDRYHELPGPLKRLLQLLRSIANDARHALQPVTAADADFCFVVLLRWLQWSFCEAKFGPRLAALTLPNRQTDALLPLGLAKLVDDSAATGEAVLSLLSTAGGADGPALLTPVLLAAAAEALVSHDRLDPARVVLDVGLRRYPRDRRLRQLMGLYWSRLGGQKTSADDLNRARRELEPLLPRAGAVATDEETFGILGGVYKRLADLDPNDTAKGQWLRKSRDVYRDGWERSGRANDYLGINAATLALWLGEGGAEIAGPIRDRLSALESRLQTAGRGPRPLTYWDQVIWAEAELLLRDWDRAGELYRDAFARFAARTGDIKSTADQARRILERMGESARAGQILGPGTVG